MNEILGLLTLPGQSKGSSFCLGIQTSCTCLGGCEAKAERHPVPPLPLWDVLSSPGALQGEGAVSQPTCSFSRSVVLCVVTGKLKVWEARDQSSKHLTKHR